MSAWHQTGPFLQRIKVLIDVSLMRTNGQRKIKCEEEIDQIDDDGNILLKLRKSSYSDQNLMFRTSKGVLLDFEGDLSKNLEGDLEGDFKDNFKVDL